MTWLIHVTFHHHCGELTWPRRTRHISWWPLVAATCKEVRPRVSLFFSSSVDLHNFCLYYTWQIVWKKSKKTNQSQVQQRRWTKQTLVSPWEEKANNTNVAGKTSKVKSCVTFRERWLLQMIFENLIFRKWATFWGGWGTHIDSRLKIIENQNGSKSKMVQQCSVLLSFFLFHKHFLCWK